MLIPHTNGLLLTRETLEQHLNTMTVEQGQQAYLAYGNLTDTVQTLAYCLPERENNENNSLA